MSLVDYLPLLRGWEFQIWYLEAPVTVVKNRVDLIKRFDDYDGWLLGISLICDDCFANPYIHYPTIPLTSLMPYGNYGIVGASMWNANGPYCPMYLRPNPLSSAGLYTVDYIPAYPMPYKTYGVAGKKGEFRVELLAELGTDSTQDSAHILHMSVARIVITEPEVFKRDLKEILGTAIPPTLMDFCRIALEKEPKK